VLVKKYEYKVVELLGKKKNQIINIIHPGMMYKNYETFIWISPSCFDGKKNDFKCKQIFTQTKQIHKKNYILLLLFVKLYC